MIRRGQNLGGGENQDIYIYPVKFVFYCMFLFYKFQPVLVPLMCLGSAYEFNHPSSNGYGASACNDLPNNVCGSVYELGDLSDICGPSV